MEGKAKFIFPILATGIVVFVVSSVVTFINIGPRADFVGAGCPPSFSAGRSRR